MENLENTIRMAQQGNPAAKEALMVEFTSMVKKWAWTPNVLVSEEDMEQDLWRYFFEDLMRFDLERFEGRYFPIYLQRRMVQHRAFLLRSFSMDHKAEWDYMKMQQEGSYVMDDRALVREDLASMLRHAGWTEKLVETAMVLSYDTSMGKAAKSLHISKQMLSKRRRRMAALLKKSPELMEFLMG